MTRPRPGEPLTEAEFEKLAESNPLAALGHLLDEAGARLLIGLKQQGKYDTVEKMREELASWEDIGKAIGWAPAAARDWYEMESRAELKSLRQSLVALRTERDEWQTAAHTCAEAACEEVSKYQRFADDAEVQRTEAEQALAGLKAENEKLEAAIVQLARENRGLEKRVEIETRAYQRLNICPDHRDKATGRCIVCDGERRGKLEERERLTDQRLTPQGTPQDQESGT